MGGYLPSDRQLVTAANWAVRNQNHINWAIKQGKMAYNTFKRKRGAGSGSGRPRKRGRTKSRSKSSSGTGSGSNIVTRQFDVRQTGGFGRPVNRKVAKFRKKVRKAMAMLAPLNVFHESILLPVEFFTLGPTNPTTQYAGGSSATAPRVDYRLMAKVDRSFFGFVKDLQAAVIGQVRIGATPVDPLPQNINNVNYCKIQQSVHTTWLNVTSVSWVLDIYECICKRDMPETSGYRTASSAWNAALAAMGSLVPNVTSVASCNPNLSGLTPYDVKGFGDFWKVYKYTRFNVSPGEKVTYDYHTKYRNINFDKWDQVECKKGVTKDILFIFNPTFASDLPTDSYCEMEWNRITHVRIPDLAAGMQISYTGSKPLV